MMMKFWKAAIWSNFSAQMPAIKPKVPINAAPSNKNTSIHTACATPTSTKPSVTANTPKPTTTPRTIAAPM